jgi:hypothetical protein
LISMILCAANLECTWLDVDGVFNDLVSSHREVTLLNLRAYLKQP